MANSLGKVCDDRTHGILNLYNTQKLIQQHKYVRARTIKSLKGKIGVNLHDLELGNGF